MNRRLRAWAFARLQEHIEDKAREADLPIEYVRPECTSQTCPECGHIGHRNSSPFQSQNGKCWVSEYHADVNAAINITECHDQWGESLPLKPAGDDISRNGSACDSATTSFETAEPSRDHERRDASFDRHRETSENPPQMILSACHGSEPSASNSDT